MRKSSVVIVSLFISMGAMLLPVADALAKKARVHVSYHAKSTKSATLQNYDLRRLSVRSSVALVVDEESGEFLYAKNINAVMPIASITKLMTAMVVIDSRQALDDLVTISEADVDTFRNTSSRLHVGTILPRFELLRLALMSSENRAAAALARTYRGGLAEFLAAMNRKASELGMVSARFVDATGLRSENAASAVDLVKMVRASYDYDLIREFTTTANHAIELMDSGRILAFKNSNSLVRQGSWNIGLSKTGFTNDAGRCLVMQAKIATKPVIIVLLDSLGRLTRIGDANRIKKWIEIKRQQA